MKGMPWKDEAGFLLVEVLVAIALIMIGLVAVMQSYPLGVLGMDSGRRQSTGIFLAEQRLEQIKAWASSTAGGQGYASITNGNPTLAACCQAEGYNAISGYTRFRRQVNVNNGPTANTKNIQVQVFYQPLTAQGLSSAETQVQVAILIVSD
jgi:Tfp pilus assembly protein PilV